MLFSKGLSEEEKRLFEERFRSLIKRSKLKGEINYDEILATLPYAIIDIDASEELIKSFEDEGIEVIRTDLPLKDRLEITLEKSDFRWMRSSALTERAYWIGAYQVTKELGIDKENRLLSRLLKTLWKRSADDTFSSTSVGAKHKVLLENIDHKNKDLTELTGNLEDLKKLLHKLNNEWGETLQFARERIEELQNLLVNHNISVSHDSEVSETRLIQLRHFISSLEEPLRRLSLLETTHFMQDRLK